MRFVKVHGTGNDFVLLPDLDDRLSLDADLVRRLCDRHFGLGADGVIRLGSGGDGADVFMDYRNADGGIAEMCGNGVRCVAKYVVDHDLVTGDRVRVGTRAGLKAVEVVDRDEAGRTLRVRVDMGAPVPMDVRRPLDVGGTAVAVTTLSMGNPHAVVEVDDVAAAPVARLGARIERHPAFPDGTNVEFIAVRARDRLDGRIWERGVGETLASGTGASAMAVAAHLLGLTDRVVRVRLPGGELEVEWRQDTLFVTGSAVEVATGVLDERWLTTTS